MILSFRFYFFTGLAILVSACTSSWQSSVDPEIQVKVEKAIQRAGTNANELEEALRIAPAEQKAGVAFLIAYMPERDLRSLTSDFILGNTNLAYKTRESFPWAKDIPEEIFFNEVLPYASLDENRDDWRADFYNRFEPYVRECATIYEALDSINLNIQHETGVDYNTERSVVNISPFQAMKERMATCTGLSFLLVNAFRSVGIPARLAGTPMWTNMRGNHSWVEVWIEGEWYFTEYYPEALNKSWFLADAGKADPENPIHWIYAVSYKPGNTAYPMVWAPEDTSIHAVNVTERYIELYQEQLRGKELNSDEILVYLVLHKNDLDEENSENRIRRRISVVKDGEEIDFGYTPSATDDLNRFVIFRLQRNTEYRFTYTGNDTNLVEKAIVTSEKSDQVIKLYLENQ